jgi:hypothetical protein
MAVHIFLNPVIEIVFAHKYTAGYLVAVIMQALMNHQAGTAHRDPLHITTHFLRASVVGPCEVVVRIVRAGKGMTNLSAELLQKVRMRELLKLSRMPITRVREPYACLHTLSLEHTSLPLELSTSHTLKRAQHH